MLINFTNHPSALWSAEQQAAAQRYGTVVDLAFPAIDPAADEAALDSLATVYADHILHLNPDAVLCQGECTFVYRVVQRLEVAGIPTLSPFSRLFLHFGGRLAPAFPTFCQKCSFIFRMVVVYWSWNCESCPEIKYFSLFLRTALLFQLIPARGRKHRSCS